MKKALSLFLFATFTTAFHVQAQDLYVPDTTLTAQERASAAWQWHETQKAKRDSIFALHEPFMQVARQIIADAPPRKITCSDRHRWREEAWKRMMANNTHATEQAWKTAARRYVNQCD